MYLKLHAGQLGIDCQIRFVQNSERNLELGVVSAVTISRIFHSKSVIFSARNAKE